MNATDNRPRVPHLEVVRWIKSDELARESGNRGGAPRSTVRPFQEMEADEFYADPPCTD